MLVTEPFPRLRVAAITPESEPLVKKMCYLVNPKLLFFFERGLFYQ